MKKRLFALLIVSIIAVLALVGCENFLTSVEPDEYTVTFDVNGGSTIESVVVNRGGLVTRPATDPTRGHDEFAGWYKDAELTTPWDFEKDVVVSDTTIYAKWNDHSHSGGQATCTSGVICEVCGEEYGKALGHNYVDDAAVAPTCTTTGLTAGYHCTNCDVRVEQLVIDALGHADKNLDHKCDACETPMGTHEAATGSHNCAYCGGVVSECADTDKNHKCDVCEASMGTHEAATGSHNCAYCGGVVTQCADTDKIHKCDVCEAPMGTHEAATGSHNCAYCGGVVSECADTDKNHKCDVCEAPMGTHEAATGSHNCAYCGEKMTDCKDEDPRDHECDICGLEVSECIDENKNHKCDICNDVMSRCADNDQNHFCDYCGVQNSHCINLDPTVDHTCDWCGAKVDECADVDPRDHECDVCGLEVSECIDENKNHKCDICNDVMSRCADNDQNHFCDWCGVQNSHCINLDPTVDHTCDWCGAKVDECVDVDPRDHECDVCGLEVSVCIDENKNHKCDICNDVMSRCADDDQNHFCDYCGVQNSHCINLDPTVDHTCDWCGAKVDECVDVDPRDHECDVCGLEVSVCIDENKNHKCDICNDVMSRCADDDHNHFCDYCGVQNSHCMDLPPYDHNCDWCGERVSECESYAVIDEAVAPTCTETGLTEGSHCSICNKVLVAQQVVAASGHRWTDATCVTPKTCSVCNTTEGNANGHTAGTAVVENQDPATCTSGGSYDSVVYCSVCHTELSRTTESTSALGHNMSDWVEVIAPTYEKEGREVRTCSRCDHSETRVVAMLTHTFGAWIQTQAPTCTEEGREVRTCTEEGCTVTEVRAIRANGHTHGPAATCTENQICTVCNAVLNRATGHTKADAVVENHTDSTCSTEGRYDTVIYCTVCDAEVSRVTSTIAKKEHTPGAAATCTVNQVCTVCDAVLVIAPGHVSVVDAAVAPTCTTAGKTEGKHCSVCNEVLVAQEVVAAKGHTEVVDAAVAPTCTTTGKTEGKHCSVCNEVLVAQEVVAAKGHTTVVDAAVAPTCTTTGKTEGKHCSVCNEVLVAQEVVAAKGHTEVVDAAVAPTCTATGLTEGSHCSACNEVLVAQEVVAAKGHTEVVDAAVAATCTTAGKTEGKHCSACNEVLVAQETVDALGHTAAEAVEENRNDSTCTVAGRYDSVVYCSVCNEELSRETNTLPLAAHTPGAEATCEAPKTCTSCGTELEPQLPHDMGDWTVILVSFTSNGLKRRDCNNCDHYETLETEPSKNYTLSFGTNGTYHSTSVDAIDLSNVQIGDNGGNNSQVKNGNITVTLKADGILTINGYNGYTVYSINDGTTTEVVTDSTYRYVATEDVTLVITADPENTGNNYFLSLDINYPVIVNENTALDLSATGAHIERTTGTYEFLYIDATSGKFADNNGGWVQVNAGTIITLYVRDRAEVLLNAYNSVDNFEISIVDGVCTIKVVGNDYINSITINYPVVVEENTLIDLSATGANIQGGKGTYGPLYVNATSGKFADNNSGWVQVNAGTIITINVLDGARVYIKAYTSVENFEIVVANGVCTITVKANDYLKSILVEYEHSYNEGVVTAPTCKAEGYTTYTCELCGHSYTGDVTEKAAHTPGEIVKENEVASTCTEAGSYDNVSYCTVCDAEISRETVEVPVAGHSGGTATCTAKAICEVCGNEYGETAAHKLNSKGVCEFGCGYKKVEGGWILVTDASQLTEGAQVIIVATKSNYALSTEDRGNNRGSVAITKNGNTVVINSSTQVITLVAGKSANTFGLKIGESYLYASSSSSNQLKAKTELDANGSWAITVTSAGVATIKATGSNTRNWLRFNSANNPVIFSAYGSGQNDVSLYVYVEGFDCPPHAHEGGTATCENAAVCEICDEQYGTTVDHASTTPATCETAEVCMWCGEEINPALTHDMADATCTEPATCKREGCNHTEGANLGHAWGEWIVTKPATEDEEGSQYRVCSRCDDEEVDVIPTLDHVHSYTSEVTTEAGCETAGVRTFTCTCGDSYEEEIIATGHTWDTVVVVDPTCTANGYTSHTCHCGNTYNDTEVPSLGHKDENNDYKCEVCSKVAEPEADTTLTIEQAIALAKAAGDSYTTNKYYVSGRIISIANTQYGNMTIRDENGKDLYIYGLYSADGKTRYDAMSTKPAVHDEITIYTVLGTYKNSEQAKDAWLVNHVPHTVHTWTDATCKAPKTCSICGITEGEVIDHNYVDGKCTMCEKDEPTGNEPVLEEKTATLSFANKAQRTTYTTSKQVWEQNGITLTNDKSKSTSNVGDYANPARFYKSSKITVEAPGDIVEISFTCGSSSYASALKNSISTNSNYTVSVSGSTVTIKFNTAVSSFVIDSLTGGQVRITSMTVKYLG